MQRKVQVAATFAARSYVSASLTVIHSQPWYRRSLRIIWNDLTRPTRQFVRTRLEQRRERKKQRTEGRRTITAIVSGPSVHFVDAKWNKEPALDLIARYLDELEKIVANAEARF